MEEGNSMTELHYDRLQTQKRQVHLPNDWRDPASLHGPCRTYAMGKPMDLGQMEALPEDLQRAYFRRLRQRGGSEETVGQMLGISAARVQQLERKYRVSLDQPDQAAWSTFCGEEG